MKPKGLANIRFKKNLAERKKVAHALHRKAEGLPPVVKRVDPHSK